MAQRIKEDIRFYLPADPYYYQVDNLPLEDLLSNDIRLQAQLDDMASSDGGNTVGRAGFTELQPFIDTGLPGTVSVRPGNFIGRAQRTNGNGLFGQTETNGRVNNGIWEFNDPPTTFGTGENPTGTYSVGNPANTPADPGLGVGRTTLFNFKGANIAIESFGFQDFEVGLGYVTPTLARIDLIGITTMNGAMDDPYLPGQSDAPGVLLGDGLPKLAVVKGAGIVETYNHRRQVVIGEKYVTVGMPAEYLNDYGRNLEGDVVPNPEFQTIPAPDDTVNINYARDIIQNGEISQTILEWASSNKNANFFLPIAYVLVPQSHVEGNPIPREYLSDIRPFFRTAELALAERQAIAASLSPSIHNPFTTVKQAKGLIIPAIDALTNTVNDLTTLVNTLQEQLGKPKIWTIQRNQNDIYTTQGIYLDPGQYIAQCTIAHGVGSNITRTMRWGVDVGGSFNVLTQTTPNVAYRDKTVNNDDDTIATQSLYFTVAERGLYQLVCPQPGDQGNTPGVYDGANFQVQQQPDGTTYNNVGTFTQVSNQFFV